MELKDLYELFLAGGGAGVLICRTKIVAPETKHWLVCLGFNILEFGEGSNAALPADLQGLTAFKSRCRRI